MPALPGANQQVKVGDMVYLDASASQAMSYLWAMTTVPTGSHCRLQDDATATPCFVADMEGEYVLTLETNDGAQATVSVQAFARDEDPGPDVGEGMPHPDRPAHPDHPDHPDHPGHPMHPDHPDHPAHPAQPMHPAHPDHSTTPMPEKK